MALKSKNTEIRQHVSNGQYQVGLVGASGFAGAEILRLISSHPDFDVSVATANSKAGSKIGDLYPNLAPHYGSRKFDTYEPELFADCEVVFCSLPHGKSMSVVPELLATVPTVVDLGSDYRLKDASLYPQWYSAEHLNPELLGTAAYGLPELFRESIQTANLIAATGCNAAASILSIAPLISEGLIEPEGVVIDLITGVSGAGRPPKENTTFCAVDENVTAYAVTSHRHTPEIEQALSVVAGTEVSVLFTPHLAPMNRGIMATCYGRPTEKAKDLKLDTASVLRVMSDSYNNEPFVLVDERIPETKSVSGSNTVQLTARVDPRTGYIISMGVLDNLVKGAAGMAIQCANLTKGIEETVGLPVVGVYP